MIGLLTFYVFLRIPLPSFCIGNEFRLEQKVWPLGAVRITAYSVLGVTLNLLLLCVFSGFTRILCPEGIGNAICKRGLKEQWRVCAVHISSPPCLLHCPTDITYKTHLQNTHSKTESMRMFTVPTEYQTKCRV